MVRSIEKIETAIEPNFQSLFVDAMAIPNKRDVFVNLAKVVDLPEVKAAGTAGKRRGRRGAGSI